MTQHHILIGPPSSGKSTLAQTLQQQVLNSVIISTDTIRGQLYGDPRIQGPWPEIFAQVLHQCHQAIAAGQTLIYDATNAKRSWRFNFLRPLLTAYPHQTWVGWHLTTPLDVCCQWNQQRDRQVPPDIIENLHHFLQCWHPIPAEGMATLQSIDPSQTPDLPTHISGTLRKLPRCITNQHNATKHPQCSFHPYSDLLAFERLLYLIRLLLEQPGAGNLHKTAPEQLKNLLGAETDLQTLETDLDELSALLGREDPIYGDRGAIAENLDWLQRNGFLSPEPSPSLWDLPERSPPSLPTHSYSERIPFLRLMGTLRFIAHHPFHGEGSRVQESLVEALQERGICCGSLPSSRNAIRKDIEVIFKPYGLFPAHRQTQGYALGTGIFSQNQLLQLHQFLAGQANSLRDPTVLDLLQTLTDRLQASKRSPLNPYPIRALYNFTITNSKDLPKEALLNTIDRLEQEIEQGQCLELQRFQGGARHGCEPESFMQVWPVQMVFHNIGWYLGYEIANGSQAGLLCFERLDRLFRGQPLAQCRDRAVQDRACVHLQKLFKASGGLFLGDNPKHQRQWLSGKRDQPQDIRVMAELWFSDRAFQFVREGDQRFPDDQICLSPPQPTPPQPKTLRPKNSKLFRLKPTGDPAHPHRCQLILPYWAWKNVDLQRWILGFKHEVRVISPPEWVVDFRGWVQAIAALYEQPAE